MSVRKKNKECRKIIETITIFAPAKDEIMLCVEILRTKVARLAVFADSQGGIQAHELALLPIIVR